MQRLTTDQVPNNQSTVIAVAEPTLPIIADESQVAQELLRFARVSALMRRLEVAAVLSWAVCIVFGNLATFMEAPFHTPHGPLHAILRGCSGVTGAAAAICLLGLFALAYVRRGWARRLVSTESPSAVGPITEALATPEKRLGTPRQTIMRVILPYSPADATVITNRTQRTGLLNQLARLLPRMTDDEAARLTSYQLDCLAELARTVQPAEHIDFIVEALRLFHRIRDTRVLSLVEQLSALRPRTDIAQRMYDTARLIVDDMRAWHAAIGDAQRLVRPVEDPPVPSTVLLRPAPAGTEADPSVLVRPAGAGADDGV